MDNLVEVLCDYFRMCPKCLGMHVGGFRYWLDATTLLRNLKLRTTHLAYNKDVKFAELDVRGSSNIPAYNGHLGVTVRQHYFARHRIELRHPHLPCVAVTGANGQKEFFPLEVLKVKN
jgi:hypothetical protein